MDSLARVLKQRSSRTTGKLRKFRTANLEDDCTRECPAIEVGLSITGRRVVEMLERVARERGYPDVLTVDNGPELRGRDLDGWAHEHGVQQFCRRRPVH